jgi:hypothetical protein
VSAAVSFFVSLVPEWTHIDLLREAVGRAVTATLGERSGDALAMVSCELLENAFKYRRSDTEAISLWVERKADRVVVSVANAVEGSSPHLAALRAQLSWIESFPTPAEAYLAALERIYEQAASDPDQGHLGLARVAFEGGCALALEVEEPDRIVVRAVRSLAASVPAPQAPGSGPEGEG